MDTDTIWEKNIFYNREGIGSIIAYIGRKRNILR